MAARKSKAAPATPAESELEEQAEEFVEELVEYGPYELVDGVSSLAFGADPLVEIFAGERFVTMDRAVAEFLDECAHAQRASA